MKFLYWFWSGTSLQSSSGFLGQTSNRMCVHLGCSFCRFVVCSCFRIQTLSSFEKETDRELMWGSGGGGVTECLV